MLGAVQLGVRVLVARLIVGVGVSLLLLPGIRPGFMAVRMGVPVTMRMPMAVNMRMAVHQVAVPVFMGVLVLMLMRVPVLMIVTVLIPMILPGIMGMFMRQALPVVHCSAAA